MNPYQHQVPTADILVVDDTPDRLRLLSVMLTERGYNVRKANDGRLALQAVELAKPDLILLDIGMPELDGYKVCRYLKASPETCKIPIIFMSSPQEGIDRAKVFEVGGVDYINYPFQLEEVSIRVQNHLTLRWQQWQLKTQNARLQEEIRERQHAEDALRIYLHAVSHDLHNSLLWMSAILQKLVVSRSKTESVAVPLSLLGRMATSCDRQLNLINSLIETHELDAWGVSLKCQIFRLYELAQDLIEDWQSIFNQHQAAIANSISPNLPQVSADPNQLWRVFENLISNALEHNPSGVRVTLDAKVIEADSQDIKFIRCTIADNGLGLPQDRRERLFELYQPGSSLDLPGTGGLGLYLCRRIINAHGGEIGLLPQNERGTTVWFTLPIAANNTQ
ncbi:MAG: hybrid sensor histidine kinase/response regulator [Cyanobacteriota bacterium]|nr:hybrid sensor histidine kinase/response regulator [Cyanobacteriota bacterium]